jgi:6-phosphogluconate dehydrogenase
MPGGDLEAYPHVQPILEAVAAKVNGEPCVAYLGKGAAGHYVKMVHNGIEYAIMQLISETYDLLHRGLGLNNDELHKVYKAWNEGELQSYLVEITRDIFLQQDDKTDNRLVDMILDKAGSKGTGKWTSQDAMDLAVPLPVIDMAVAMRDMSAYKEERQQAAALYKTSAISIDVPKEIFIQQLNDALYFASIICYAQGLAMLYRASSELDMQIPIPEVVKVWRGGCIIRSSQLEIFHAAYQEDPKLPNLLLDKTIAKLLQARKQHLRNVIMHAMQTGYPIAGLMAALSYFDAYHTERMPTNLIQAQRDYFGAHTYQRIDMPGTFHTEWKVS